MRHGTVQPDEGPRGPRGPLQEPGCAAAGSEVVKLSSSPPSQLLIKLRMINPPPGSRLTSLPLTCSWSLTSFSMRCSWKQAERSAITSSTAINSYFLISSERFSRISSFPSYSTNSSHLPPYRREKPVYNKNTVNALTNSNYQACPLTLEEEI